MTPADLRERVAAATPGPWARALPSNLPGDSPVIKNLDHFDWVASVQVSNITEWRENAALIALAPDLALALADALEEIQDPAVVSRIMARFEGK